MTRQAIKTLFRRWQAKGATTPKTITSTIPGYYDDLGDWVPPGTNQVTEETALMCAILPLKADFINGSGGVYTSRDREIYLYEPLQARQEITYKGVTYKVEDELDTSDFSGVYIYTLKAVSSFAER